MFILLNVYIFLNQTLKQHTLILLMTLVMSFSKPISSILSASSKTKKETLSRESSLEVTRSRSLPGVATTKSHPDDIVITFTSHNSKFSITKISQLKI